VTANLDIIFVWLILHKDVHNQSKADVRMSSEEYKRGGDKLLTFDVDSHSSAD